MSRLLPYVKYVAKAAVAGAGAFCTGAAVATVDGTFAQSEVWTVLGGTVAAVGLVFGIRNGANPKGS